MLKFLLFVGIVSVVYFCGVGFLRTAERFGWTDAPVPAKPLARR